MIEIIQQKDSAENSTEDSPKEAEANWQSVEGLPKNFRQIGSPEGNKRVYIEDYVYTYLHPSFSGIQEQRICILVGQTKEMAGCLCIYVNGALELQEVAYAGSAPILSEAVRAEICLQMERYFPGDVLLGWFYDQKGVPPKVTPEIERVFKNFFGGNNRILLLSDSLERDETLFFYEDGAIRKKSGYYIYYERNKAMQEYMIRTRQDTPGEIKPEEVRDEALKSYREMVLKRSESKNTGMHSLVYGTGLLVLVAACVIGVSMFNNYQKMKDLESAVRTLQPEVENVQPEETQSSLIIENLEGGVEPEDTSSVQDVSAQPQGQQGDGQENTGNDIGDGSVASQDTLEGSGVPDLPEDGGTSQDSANGGSDTAGDVPASAEPVLTAEQQALQQGYYIVQQGDSLSAISKRLYQDVSKAKEICAVNQLEDIDSIYEGQKLILP
ncbi:MAG: LysM peptidoglycan-binding domain-containing protein [Lachnospiraceae bacterium]|nr:LysM peptidoglycan-binding domain-containing protein [Lachnospiraceae bacterium]